MKYNVGDKLEYTGKNYFLIKIIDTSDDLFEDYICEVVAGKRSVGHTWHKSEDYLDREYKVVERASSFDRQKRKLEI